MRCKVKKIISVLLIVCIFAAVCALVACGKNKEKALSSYDIFIVYDEQNQSLSGTVDFGFYNCYENEFNDLKFNLYGNAFREGAAYSPVSEFNESRAYYNGASYGDIQITNVENCAGWNISGEDQNILTVNLLSPVYPEQRVNIKISYTLNLAKINHRTGVTKNTVNLGNFYPILCAYTQEGFIECPYYSCGDPFVSDCANYTVTVDIPEAYHAATSGVQQSQIITDGRKKTQYVLANARDFALVLSDKFEILSQDVDGVTVNYYYVTDKNAEQSLKAAAESLSYFNKTFGSYAYPSLSVVQTGFCYGGMEYPALTMIAEGQTLEQNIYTIVHENAHQWWYAMVGNNQLTCGWQDEGLAEYSTLMFFENNPDYGYTRSGIVLSATRAYRAFFSVYSQLKGETDTTMTRNLGTYTSEYEYTNVTYNKGLIMFDMLRNAVGSDKFVTCIQNYFKNYSGKIAEAEALIAEFKGSGLDVEGIFSAFIEGKIII